MTIINIQENIQEAYKLGFTGKQFFSRALKELKLSNGSTVEQEARNELEYILKLRDLYEQISKKNKAADKQAYENAVKESKYDLNRWSTLVSDDIKQGLQCGRYTAIGVIVVDGISTLVRINFYDWYFLNLDFDSSSASTPFGKEYIALRFFADNTWEEIQASSTCSTQESENLTKSSKENKPYPTRADLGKTAQNRFDDAVRCAQMIQAYANNESSTLHHIPDFDILNIKCTKRHIAEAITRWAKNNNKNKNNWSGNAFHNSDGLWEALRNEKVIGVSKIQSSNSKTNVLNNYFKPH